MKKNLFLLVAIAAIALIPFGGLNAKKVYTVQEMIEKAPELVGKTVEIKGIAQHVCATTGKKLFLATADGKRTFRVNAGKDMGRFDRSIIKSVVVAKGVVTENRTYMEDLDKQEAAVLAAEKAQKEPEHCNSEAKAQGESLTATPVQRVQALKAKLQQQIDNGGKNYMSFYTIDGCSKYKVSK